MTAKLTKIKSALRETIRLADALRDEEWVLLSPESSRVCGMYDCGTEVDFDEPAISAFIVHARTFTKIQAESFLAAIEALEQFTDELALLPNHAIKFAKETLQTICDQWPE